MFLQATISCECGCVSRFEFQDKAGKDTYVCPCSDCGRNMDKTAYKKLTVIMAELIDWNMDMSKNAEGLHEPKMRAIALTMADMP